MRRNIKQDMQQTLVKTSNLNLTLKTNHYKKDMLNFLPFKYHHAITFHDRYYQIYFLIHQPICYINQENIS